MDEQTLDTSPPPSAAPAALGAFRGSVLGEWRHSLVVIEGTQPGRRIEIEDKPVVIGRRTAADLVLTELQVSGLHCRVRIEAGRPALKVTDLNSTNGTYINGQRVLGTAYLAPGGTLCVGRTVFRHDFLSPELLVMAAYEDAVRESTVAAWLPSPLTQGPVRTECCYRAAEPPRGAGVAVLPLADRRTAFVLIDVAGPAEHVARHAARVLQELREITDVTGAAALLQQLHDRWRLGAHVGLFFTAWAGVYDPATRQLQHASAGHHAALLRVPHGEMLRLEALNPPVGLLPGTEFADEACPVPAGSQLYLFNRGVFEFLDRTGRQLSLDDFEVQLACGPNAHEQTPDQVYVDLRRLAEAPRLDDDFLLLRAHLG
jgi:hypothetical protein